MVTKFGGKNPWPKRTALLGSKVMQGSAGVKKGSTCLAMPYGHQIWREEPLTRAQCIAGVKGHAGVSQGQPEIKLLRSAVWPPNLVERTLDQSVTHCWVRGHAGVSQGQPEVKVFRNALWPPNLAERTPDQSVMHRWVKGHAGVSWGQPEGSCLEMRKAIKCSQCYRALCSCRCSSITKISKSGGVCVCVYICMYVRLCVSPCFEVRGWNLAWG